MRHWLMRGLLIIYKIFLFVFILFGAPTDEEIAQHIRDMAK